MIKLHHQDKKTQELVKRFSGYIFRLKQLRYIHSELFEDKVAQSLMERTAHGFFLELNNILCDYFLLEVAKLTDPSVQGNYENFTVFNLIETVEWPSDYRQEIENLSKEVISFRGHIKSVRNKFIAHYDKESVLSCNTFEIFPKDEDQKLLAVLERICNVFHKAAFGQILGKMVPSYPGDVCDLKHTLKQGIAFDKLFSDSKGNDLALLYKRLKDVDSG